MKYTKIISSSLVMGCLYLCGVGSASAEGGLPEKIYAFGDSLSDIGNTFQLSKDEHYVLRYPPAKRFFDGRYSDGPIWLDTLANLLGIKKRELVASSERRNRNARRKGYSVVSYAYGFAGTDILNSTVPSPLFDPLEVPGLKGQVAEFTTAYDEADPDALYTVWSGANDYILGLLGIVGVVPDPLTVVGNITEAVEDLYDAGARNFMIFNLPDLGQTPAGALFDIELPGTQYLLTLLTNGHNFFLQSAVAALDINPMYSDATFHYVDAYALFQLLEVSTEPGAAWNCLVDWNLLTPSQAADIPDQSCDKLKKLDDDDTQVYWDEIHPSKTVHGSLGVVAHQCLLAPGSCAVPTP